MRHTFVIFVVLLGLAFAAPADARQCIGTTIYGDHVAAANDFQARGVGCRDALLSAAKTHSTAPTPEKGIASPFEQEREEPRSEFIFTAPARSYHWTCRLGLPRRDDTVATGRRRR